MVPGEISQGFFHFCGGYWIGEMSHRGFVIQDLVEFDEGSFVLMDLPFFR